MGEGAGGKCCVEDGYELVGDVPFIGAALLGSRDDLAGAESSMESIDMLLPGRAVEDRAGSSRALENEGFGGGGICDMGVRMV